MKKIFKKLLLWFAKKGRNVSVKRMYRAINKKLKYLDKYERYSEMVERIEGSL